MIIVGADIPATFAIPEPDHDYRLTEHTRQLIERGELVFGHWVFRRRHNLFPFLARHAGPETRLAIARDIAAACKEKWADNGTPDIVLVPSSSTVSYLIPSLPAGFADMTATLVPEGWSDDDYSLRLVPSDRTAAALTSDRPRVLFLDTDVSSGVTEQRARDAVRRRLSRTAEWSWLTYTIILRGVSYDHTPKGPQRLAPLTGLERKPRAFAEIHPRIFAFGSCPMCEADRRLQSAAQWVLGARPQLGRLIAEARAFLRPRAVEGPQAQPDLATNPAVVARLLELHTHGLPASCARISLQPVADPDLAEAASLFVGLRFRDVRQFLSTDQVVEIVLERAQRAAVDPAERMAAWLAALALLPVSVLLQASSRLVPDLLKGGAAIAASAVVSLALAEHQRAMAAVQPSDRAFGSDHEGARLQAAVYDNFRGQLDGLRATSTSESEALELIRADIVPLERPALRWDVLGAVRRAAALLREGNHRSFLNIELRDVGPEGLDAVHDHLSEAFAQLRLFGELAGCAIEAAVGSAMETLEEAKQAGDVDAYKKLAAAAITQLWSRPPVSSRFYPVRRLKSAVVIAINQVSETLAVTRSSKLFVLVDEDEIAAARGYMAVGPHIDFVVSFCRNLMRNSIQYFRGGGGRGQAWPPLGEAAARFFRDDYRPADGALGKFSIERSTAGDLEIVYRSRGAPTSEAELFEPIRGISNVRGHFNVVGGSIRYDRRTNSGGGEFANEFRATFPFVYKVFG